MNQEQVETTAKLYLMLAKDQVQPLHENYLNTLKQQARVLCDKMFLQIFNESYQEKFNFDRAIDSWHKIKQSINLMELEQIL
jgi:glycerol dehydrogenase-like iron-containing ADH family enzyme